MSKEKLPVESEFILYTNDNGEVRLDVLVLDETVWLTQEGMRELFGRSKSTISEHISNVFKEGELNEDSVVRKFRTTALDGKKYETAFYNLDVIISVGYRVKSHKGTQYRIWATNKLREYIIKGFVLDDDRLKQGRNTFSRDYFRELLERVRSIRASERRIYQQITDIFAECSINYDPKSDTTRNFFAAVQNKFHYAITGKTSAEIIFDKSDKSKRNMGLQTWKNAPDGRIIKQDAKTAKNYLTRDELKKLERTVSGFFDYIENILENYNTFTMEQFAVSVNKFLEFNEYKTLDNKGKVTRDKAISKALREYDVFNKTQKIESDFDKQVKEMKNNQL